MATDCFDKLRVTLKEPKYKDGKHLGVVSIPCGKCARCLTRRKMEWSYRIENEMENSKTAYFITLTYSPETVPYNKYGKKTLNKKDLTDFFKRLRINQERSDITLEHLYNRLSKKDKIKYFACGEYGEERGRPHYHAIVFNVSASIIDKSWGKGNTHCVKANNQSIAYVMKYLDKRLGAKVDKSKVQEFHTMSEGIGINYIEKNKIWHKDNLDIVYITNRAGIKIPMPRYYRMKMLTEEQRLLQAVNVELTLNQLRDEKIENIGEEAYNKIKNIEKKYSDIKFSKQIKKRLLD